jgi:copper chaperone CopZ
MNKFFTLIIFCLAINYGYAETVNHKFITSGNCIVCKFRIEEAVLKLDGIISVHWDYNTDATTVEYNDQITDLHIIMKAIAQVGHDTEWYPADSAAYAFLIGSCCEYDRIIDYSKVQIGFLSLENTWVSVEKQSNSLFNIYPTIIEDTFLNIEVPAYSTNNYQMRIFNSNGTLVYCADIIHANDKFDLSLLASGNYFISISDNKTRIFNTRIIKK